MNSLFGDLGSSPHCRRRRSVPAACGRRCRKATVIRDYLFLRQTQVAKYFNRTPRILHAAGFHSQLIVSVAPALPAAGFHPRLLRVHPAVVPCCTSMLTLFMITRIALYGLTLEFDRNASAGRGGSCFRRPLPDYLAPQDARAALIYRAWDGFSPVKATPFGMDLLINIDARFSLRASPFMVRLSAIEIGAMRKFALVSAAAQAPASAAERCAVDQISTDVAAGARNGFGRQSETSRRSLRKRKNSTPSRKRRFIISGLRTISPTIAAILGTQK